MPDAKMILRLTLRVLAKLGYVFLIAPWAIASLLAAGFRRVDAAARVAGALPRVTASYVLCPRGHRSATLGMWECRGCGGLFAGWAFQACPICSAPGAGHIACEHCG